jgi:hypothetical protein
MHRRGRYEMMAGMKAAWICALLIASSSAQPGPALHKCHINVVDPLGAVIGHALFFVHHDPAGTTTATSAVPDRILNANENGELELPVPDGFYDVCVMSPAFTPTCRKLIIRGHDTALKFQLSVSSEVSELLGDKLPTQ